MFRVNSTLPAPMIVTFAMLGSVAGGPEMHNIAHSVAHRGRDVGESA